MIPQIIPLKSLPVRIMELVLTKCLAVIGFSNALALGNDLPIDLLAIVIVALNDQHDPVAGAECRVVIVEGIIAHDGHPIRQIAKHPSTVLPCYHPLAMRLYWVPKYRSIERIWNGFFYGDCKTVILPVIGFNNTPQRLPGVIHLTKIG